MRWLQEQKKDVIDMEHLLDLWQDLGKSTPEGIFHNFGDYKSAWGECAPRADLCNFHDLVKSMRRVSPELNIGYGDLKEAAQALLQRDPSQKPKPNQSIMEASQYIADKLLIVQKHMRNLAFNAGHESKLSKFLEKLTNSKAERFKCLVKSLQDARALAKGSPEKKKKLMPHLSEVSTPAKDEYGLPLVPCSQQSGDSILDDEGHPLPSRKRDIKEMYKKPCASPKKLAKKPSTKTKTKTKTPEKPSKGKPKLYLTKGTLQSYICAVEPGEDKKHLWVAITKKQSAAHKSVAEQIFKDMPSSKEEALKMRDDALK